MDDVGEFDDLFDGTVLYLGDYKRCGKKIAESCFEVMPKTLNYFHFKRTNPDKLDDFCKDCRSFMEKIKYREKKKRGKNKETKFKPIGYNGNSEIYC